MIPGNDDSLKSVQLFVKTIADSCLLGKSRRQQHAHDDEKPKAYDASKEGMIFDKEGHSVKVVKKKG